MTSALVNPESDVGDYRRRTLTGMQYATTRRPHRGMSYRPVQMTPRPKPASSGGSSTTWRNGVDRLRADPRIPRYVDHRATGRDQVEHLAGELRRTSTPAHEPSVELRGQDSNDTTPRKTGHTTAVTLW
ncbi:hypothetical protein [Geodermatophilus sp. URMC 65]